MGGAVLGRVELGPGSGDREHRCAQDAEDRRRWILRLTPAGEAMYRDIVPAARAREAELLSVLSESELGQLDGLIDKLYRRASQLLRGGA